MKLDPSQGTITGVNVQGNIDPKDAYNFYQKNKQYLPSGQQMLNAGKQGVNFYNQVNNNNTGNTGSTGNKSSGLANLLNSLCDIISTKLLYCT